MNALCNWVKLLQVSSVWPLWTAPRESMCWVLNFSWVHVLWTSLKSISAADVPLCWRHIGLAEWVELGCPRRADRNISVSLQARSSPSCSYTVDLLPIGRFRLTSNRLVALYICERMPHKRPVQSLGANVDTTTTISILTAIFQENLGQLASRFSNSNSSGEKHQFNGLVSEITWVSQW